MPKKTPTTYKDMLDMAYDGLREKYFALYPPVERTFTTTLQYEHEGWQVHMCPRCIDRIIYHPVYCTWSLVCHCAVQYQPRGRVLVGVGVDYSKAEHAMMRESIERLVALQKQYPAIFAKAAKQGKDELGC